MKSNIMPMQNGIVKAGEFSYTRKARSITAYGETFELPAKTVEFGDKLDSVREEIITQKRTSETIKSLKKGISLFIGSEAVEKIYPNEKLMELDVDEVFGFWTALNFEFNRTQNEFLARYSAANAIRR